MGKIKTAVIIYDDGCSLCRGCMKWIKLHAIREDAFEFIPCQSEERRNRFPEITDKACRESFHIVLPNNRILAGDKALPEVLNRLKGFKWLSILFKAPVIRVFLYAVYRGVSNNRFIISQTIKPLTEE
ncbi:MAG TPA: thiol-disulfide oxidoreductase DCC family protein [Candidatus Wunengus sp. YC63]|uniref:thiol-disulfide oxidoreductase DCC family protein n=1 Tax=Candidatus Wunengus sp. YC63 TaxID=3367699 RepID=UPI004029FE40